MIFFTPIPMKYAKFLSKLTKEIWIFNTSLLSLSALHDQSTAFYNQLKSYLPNKKIIFKDYLETDHEMWQANEKSVQIANEIKSLFKSESQSFYFHNYLKRSLQPLIAKKIFLKLTKAPSVKIFLCVAAIPKLPLLSTLIDLFVICLYTCILPLILLNYLRKNTTTNLFPAKKVKGGICFDFIQGMVFDEKGNFDINSLNDTFLINNTNFNFKNSSFLCLGWTIKEPLHWQTLVESNGANIFGDKLKKIQLSYLEVLKVLFKTFILWLDLFLKPYNSNNEGWRLHANHKLKYAYYYFRSLINFNNNVPSVYVSRLDYSPMHHAIAAACNNLGIKTYGTGHSPIAGTGHTPNLSFISFDKFFTYHPIIWEQFYPSWKNPKTKIFAVGVWKTDFAKNILLLESRVHKINEIKQKLPHDFTVALHLPVPETCLYDKKRVMHWMSGFEEIISKFPQTNFILFARRRLDPYPIYFLSSIQELCKMQNVFLDSNLVDNWGSCLPWLNLCDLVIGCTFSDVMMEALCYGVPSFTYSDIGKGQTFLEKIDTRLTAYSLEELSKTLSQVIEGSWPTASDMDKLQRTLTGKANGNLRDLMWKEISLDYKSV